MFLSVILVAAGHGRRFGPPSQRPKQFKPLRGRPLVYWPLRAIQRTPAVREIVLVVAREYLGWARAFARRAGLTKVRRIVEGGAERADSVRRGWRAVDPRAGVVLVHDAARALVTREIVERVAAAARRHGAALAAWPVPDTIKKARPGRTRVAGTVPRRDLWLAQTPQGFRRDVAERVFRRSPGPLTDDVQLAERAGRPVELVLGAPENFKVTLPQDFRICGTLLKERMRDGATE